MHPGPSSREETRPPYPIAPYANLPSTPWAITSFRRTRIHSPKSARTPLKNVWYGRLHAIVQECKNFYCAITSANNFSGQSVVISSISPVQLAESVRTFPEQPVYFSYTSKRRKFSEGDGTVTATPITISFLPCISLAFNPIHIASQRVDLS